MKRNFGMICALALVAMLGACAGPGGLGASSSASGVSGSSKVEAYGVIDGGVTLVK
ncbi:hypothetical protein [Pandoraea sp. NPDC087047]|uniref:hypothetical protein n=1 Tax=Pandoraea sp. NPDC087047 TaxID=3364390 RepID=UPI0038224175